MTGSSPFGTGFGVASVDSFGGLVGDQIAVDRINWPYNLPINNIEQSLIEEIPTCRRYRSGEDRFLVRTLGEFKTLDEIAAIPITLPAAVPSLSDCRSADLQRTRPSFSRPGEAQCHVFLRESDSNTVQVAGGSAELQKLRGLPDNLTMKSYLTRQDKLGAH